MRKRHKLSIADVKECEPLGRKMVRLWTEFRGKWSGPLTSSSPELARLGAAPLARAGVEVSLPSGCIGRTYVPQPTLDPDRSAFHSPVQ